MMTKLYIKINGIEYDTGRKTTSHLVSQLEADYGHPLVAKNKLAVRAYHYKDVDKLVVLTLEGNFSESEIETLINNPWQIFKPALTEFGWNDESIYRRNDRV